MFLWVFLLTGLKLCQFDSVDINVLLFVRYLQYFLNKKQDLIGKPACCFLTNVKKWCNQKTCINTGGIQR